MLTLLHISIFYNKFASQQKQLLIMVYFYYRIIIIAIFAITFTAFAKAQTCQINCGVNHEGCMHIKEVYEYDYVTDKPTFPGGETKLLRFVNKTREYPKEAYEKGIEGRVICSFVVAADGSICLIQIMRGVEKTLNEEAIRIIKSMPKWEPGKIDGKPVPVRVIYPIPFRK